MLLVLPLGLVPEPPPHHCFVIEPQRIDHAEADYEAVMASAEHLRSWSFSDWPEDDFSLAQNSDDLQMHIDEARAGIAYGFTIFTPDRSKVLGSLYLNPLEMFASYYKLDDAANASFARAQVEVDYWLRPENEADREFHRKFVVHIQQWLVEGWGYKAPLWGSRTGFPERRKFFESISMEQALKLPSRNAPPRHMWLHWGPPLK